MKHRFKKEQRAYKGAPSDWPRQGGWLVDIFAYSEGYCNGPECLDCGQAWCHHHYPEVYSEECPARS
jgi:hypothetical protein